jgi:DNA-binding CsgD family transcriptional regulator
VAVPVADPNDILTPRQLEYIALIASGHTIDQIAAIKFDSYWTVKRDLTIARERVGAITLAHLAVVCLDAGVLKRNGRRGNYLPVQDERVVG